MAKSLFEELGGKYERQGDYLIPCLTVPAEEEQAIGIWGQRHLDYLKQYRKVTYTNLLTSGRLNAYLADINRQAQERFERLIEGMKQAQGITEQLKAENALEWTGCLLPVLLRRVQLSTVSNNPLAFRICRPVPQIMIVQ